MPAEAKDPGLALPTWQKPALVWNVEKVDKKIVKHSDPSRPVAEWKNVSKLGPLKKMTKVALSLPTYTDIRAVQNKQNVNSNLYSPRQSPIQVLTGLNLNFSDRTRTGVFKVIWPKTSFKGENLDVKVQKCWTDTCTTFRIGPVRGY